MEASETVNSVSVLFRHDGSWRSAVTTYLDTDYGWQLAWMEDDLWGVTTLPDKSLVAVCLSQRTGSVKKLPALYKALGRPSVAYSIDTKRFYVAYRGTNDGVYLVYTEDFEKWTDLGRVGSKYAKTAVAPAIGLYRTYEEGEGFLENMIVTGVGADKYIYYTTLQTRSGKRGTSWTKIDGTGTQSALSMTTDGTSLVLFHTAYNNKGFFYQFFEPDEDQKWTALQKVNAPDISSGVAAVGLVPPSYGQTRLGVAYKGAKSTAMWHQMDTRGNWEDPEEISEDGVRYQLGAVLYAREPMVTIPLTLNYDDDAAHYEKVEGMDEKSSVWDRAILKEEIECKWQKGRSSKGLLQFFCC